MESGYAVERADLRAWAKQVERASEDMQSAQVYAQSQITDGDFGMILDSMSEPYETVLRQFHSVLGEDHMRLDKASTSLKAAERVYKGNERQSADRFAHLDSGTSGDVEDDGQAGGFADISNGVSHLEQPKTEGLVLPEVSFGWLLDKACELVEFVGGPDLRETVTKWIAGDIDKAAIQAQAWEATATCTAVAKANLASGQEHISLTWSGDGADAAQKYYRKWLNSLGDQSRAMQKVAEHLRDAVDEAVAVAQVVCDIIKTIGNLATAALTNAFIPGYGQWKLVKNGKEAVRLVWKALSVLKVFWNLLKSIVDTFKGIMTSFNAAELPPSPKAVPQ